VAFFLVLVNSKKAILYIVLYKMSSSYGNNPFYQSLLGTSQVDNVNSAQVNTQSLTVSTLSAGLVSATSGGTLQNANIGTGLSFTGNTLNNTGLTSITSGQTGPVYISQSSTGSVEIALPQNITTSSSPQFARLLNSSISTFNVIQGTNAGAAFSGDRCVLIGDSVMASTSSSQQSTAIGNSALGFATGNFNTAVGSSAGFAVTTGTTNTIFGTNAGRGSTPLTTGSGNVLLGAGANTSSASSSNEIVIGFGSGSGSNTAKIYASNGLNVSNLTNGVLKATSGTITSTATTDDLTEGKTNLYYTDARARLSVSDGSGISYNNSSGLISNSGVTSLTGTTNRVTVSAATGNITVTGPQDINTSSSPTFAGLTIGSLSGVLKTTAGVISGSSTTDDLPEGKTNAYFTIPRARSAFIAIAPMYVNTGIIYLGYSSSNLKLNGADLDTIQNISTSSSPQFARLLNSSINSSNVLIGTGTGGALTSGGGNTFIGQNSGAGCTTGTFNIGIGPSALQATLTASNANNVAVGVNSLFSCTSGTSNIGLGANSLISLNTGSNNIQIGNGSVNVLTSGSANVYIGPSVTASSSSVNNECVISANPNATTGKGTNTCFINSSAGLFSYSPAYCQLRSIMGLSRGNFTMTE